MKTSNLNRKLWLKITFILVIIGIILISYFLNAGIIKTGGFGLKITD